MMQAINSKTTLHTFADTETLDQHLATEIVDHLQRAIGERGQASLAVSGGKTPIGLFKLLSRQPVAWGKVAITLVDERWVDTNDQASNEKLVHEHLLQGLAAQAHFISLKNSSPTPFIGAMQSEQALSALHWPLDVLLLGMGEDGHTASLFPGAKDLPAALAMDSGRLCMGITPLTAPHDRLTLTLPALLNSRQIYLHLQGKNKMEVYQRAVAGSDIAAMPVRAILQQRGTPVAVVVSAE